MPPVHDYVIDNSTGANVRQDINNALAAIVSNNSSSSQPTTRYAYMWWADTTTGILKIRNSANDGWIELLQLDGTLTLENGTVSAPALAFRDDLDTGIFSSSDNIFDIATGGVARLQIDSSETTFNEDGVDTDFRIESDTQTHMFFLDAGNNRIGINKSNPSHTVHIVPLATSTDGTDSVTNSTVAINALFVRNKGNSAGLSGQTYSNQVISSNGSNVAFEIYTQGSATGCPIVFGINAIEKARLDASGNFCIGTTTANALLDVNGQARFGGNKVTLDTDGSLSGKISNSTTRAFILSNTDVDADFFGGRVFQIGPDGTISIGGSAGTNPASYSAPTIKINPSGSTNLQVKSGSGDDSRIHIIAGTNQKNSIIRFGDPDDDNRGAIDYDHNGDSLSFRIAGTADVLLFNSLGYAAFSAAVPNTNAFLMDNKSSTNPEGLYLRFSFASPNTQNRHFLKCTDSTSDRAVIDSNGNSRNINNSYAGFSDISLKENIVDASSQWDDIKNLRVRVFNFKIDSPSDKRIGVVAQEIETVCPKLVEEVFDKDSDGNLLETSTKSVKYSVLYMKAVKCLQEAITKIEVLETKVAALEAA